jgi:hypothetical protein
MIQLILSTTKKYGMKCLPFFKIPQPITNGKASENYELTITLNSNQFVIIFTSTFIEHIHHS